MAYLAVLALAEAIFFASCCAGGFGLGGPPPLQERLSYIVLYCAVALPFLAVAQSVALRLRNENSTLRAAMIYCALLAGGLVLAKPIFSAAVGTIVLAIFYLCVIILPD